MSRKRQSRATTDNQPLAVRSRKRQSRAATDHQPPAISMELALDNDDLLMQILQFVPAKSLTRFKSVCKRWLSLISSDHFYHQHTLRRPKLQQSIIVQMMHTEQLFYLNGEKVMIPYSMSVLDGHEIVQYCHGLLLLESVSRKNSYYVYNPTTRRLRKVILTKTGDFPYVVSITLAFDPSKSPYYKLVCFRSTAVETNTAYYAYQIEVYDSESHTWKLGLKGSSCNDIYDDGLHWNNYIFWRTHGDNYFCFDIAKNEINTVSFRSDPYDLYDNTCNYLQEANGHLYSFDLLEIGQRRSGVVSEVGGDDRSLCVRKFLGPLCTHPEMDTTPVLYV